MRVRPLMFVLIMLLFSFCLPACNRDCDTGAARIEILIDDMGIPHIYASTDEDVFFGAGYQMATDRLYQMAMLRRFSLGRLSEVLGEAGLERDLQARTFDFPRWGRMDAELMQVEDPERAGLVSAWVRGINRRIGEILDGTAPPPFGYGAGDFDFLPEPWEEADPYIVLKGANFALDKAVEFEVAVTLLSTIYSAAMSSVQIFKPAHPVFSMPPDERPPSQGGRISEAPTSIVEASGWSRDESRASFEALKRWINASPGPTGSNNWAIDGRFTENGRPLLGGDPHLSFDFFGAPYPMHINSADQGGTYNVAGFAYPGTPGIAIGFNEHVIWSPTSAYADVNDTWKVMKIFGRANVGGDWLPITEREEQILVREDGDPVGEGRIETRTYEEVAGYGVILPREIIGIPIGGPYLMNWTGFTARPARWFMELNRVSSIDDFEEAVDRMREMNYNFVAADADGISMRVGVDVPLRTDVSGDRTPWRAMPAQDAGSLWTGELLPRTQLPGSRALERGWLATANNDPFGFTADGYFDDDPWYYGSFFIAGYRAKRIEDELARLAGRGDVTIEDMKAMQNDLHSTLADDLLPLLAEAHSRIGVDPDLDPFIGQPDLDELVAFLTADWDRRMARESAGALAFQAFLHFLTEGAIKDDILLGYDTAVGLQTIFVLKVAALAIQGEYPEGGDVLQEGRDVILLTAASDVVAWLLCRYGSVEPEGYAYEDLKVTSFDDAFGYGMPVFSRPTDGGEDTLSVSQNITFAEDADAWVTTYVPVERMVGSFAADGTPEAFVNFPVGAAADPGSPDTETANSDYIEGRYRKLLFDRAEIEAAARERIVLAP